MVGQWDWEDDQAYWERRKEDDKYALESSAAWAKITTGLMESRALSRWIERVEATRTHGEEGFIAELLTRGITRTPGRPQNPTNLSFGFGRMEYLKRDCMVSRDGIGDGFLTTAELECAIQLYRRKNDESEARNSEAMLQGLREGGYDAKDYLPDALQELDRNHRRWAVVMLLLAYEGDSNRSDWGDITEEVVHTLRVGCSVYLQSEQETAQAQQEIDVIAKKLGFH